MNLREQDLREISVALWGTRSRRRRAFALRSWEHAVAATHLAFIERPLSPLPTALNRKLHELAAHFVRALPPDGTGN